MAEGLHGHTTLQEVVSCDSCLRELSELLSEEFYGDVRQADGAYVACPVCGQEQADRSVNYLAPGQM